MESQEIDQQVTAFHGPTLDDKNQPTYHDWEENTDSEFISKIENSGTESKFSPAMSTRDSDRKSLESSSKTRNSNTENHFSPMSISKTRNSVTDSRVTSALTLNSVGPLNTRLIESSAGPILLSNEDLSPCNRTLRAISDPPRPCNENSFIHSKPTNSPINAGEDHTSNNSIVSKRLIFSSKQDSAISNIDEASDLSKENIKDDQDITNDEGTMSNLPEKSSHKKTNEAENTDNEIESNLTVSEDEKIVDENQKTEEEPFYHDKGYSKNHQQLSHIGVRKTVSDSSDEAYLHRNQPSGGEPYINENGYVRNRKHSHAGVRKTVSDSSDEVSRSKPD